MAKKFLTSIDLSKCELLNASIHNLASAPSSPADGQVYFNTSDGQMYFYNGSSWQSMAGDITAVSITAGTGISVSQSTNAAGEYTATVSLAHLGIENLVAPGEDSILFFDVSGAATDWLTVDVATGIKITDRVLSLGAIPNSSLTNSSLTVTAGAGLTDGGVVALGGTVTLNVGAGTGITVNADSIELKNSANLSNNYLPKWDSTNGQLVDSIVYGDGTNIGINTAAPEADLHVVGKNNGIGTILIETDSLGIAQADQASLHFRVADNENAWKKFAIIAENTGDDHGRGALHFALDNTAAGDSAVIADSRLTILSDGTVGIATTTPDSNYILDVNGAMHVAGNLTVDGTVTYINSTTVEVGDNILLLNSGATGAAAANAGFEIERGDDTNVSFIWNETNDYWSTVDQAFHIGSIATETVMTGRTVLIQEGGVVKQITAANVVGEGLTLTEGNGIDITDNGGGSYTIAAEVASTTNQGVVELADAAETNAMTDTARAVTPASLAKLRFTEPLNPGGATTVVVNHGLSSFFCIVQVMEIATGATVECDVRRVDPDHVELDFCTAPADGALQVMVIKVA